MTFKKYVEAYSDKLYCQIDDFDKDSIEELEEKEEGEY